jgi:proteasome lid subunit RPN8/RPN11
MKVLLTPEVITLVDRELAAQPPERLMHVLGTVRPDGSLIVIEGLIDWEAEASSAHVRPSPEAENRIQRLERQQRLSYLGVIHSHPPSVPEPSHQDFVALQDLQRLNPHMLALLVGVVVQRNHSGSDPEPLHALKLDHGRLSLHGLTPANPHPRPVRVREAGDRPDFWQAAEQRVPDGSLRGLHGAHAVVIGAGSVGSNIAEHLVRAGVPRLTLVDDEVVEPVNLTRTVYDYRDVGRKKTSALRDHLVAINPDLQVTLVDDRLGASTASTFRHVLSDASIAIGAADDNLAMGVLDVLLHECGLPGVFAAVYKGAAGGDIVTVVPGVTACWRCTVGPRQQGTLLPALDYGTGRLEGEIALGVDIATIAVLAARTVLGVFCTMADSDRFLERPLVERRTFVQVGLTPGFYGDTGLFADTPAQHAWQSTWVSSLGDPDCPECGATAVKQVEVAEPKHWARAKLGLARGRSQLRNLLTRKKRRSRGVSEPGAQGHAVSIR